MYANPTAPGIQRSMTYPVGQYQTIGAVPPQNTYVETVSVQSDGHQPTCSLSNNLELSKLVESSVEPLAAREGAHVPGVGFFFPEGAVRMSITSWAQLVLRTSVDDLHILIWTSCFSPSPHPIPTSSPNFDAEFFNLRKVFECTVSASYRIFCDIHQSQAVTL